MNHTIEELEYRIEELEALLGMPHHTPCTIPMIGPVVWKLLGLFTKRRSITRGFAFAALYGHKPEADQPANERIIDVHVSRANKVLQQYGLQIQTEMGEGYYVTPQGQVLLCQLMNRGSSDGKEVIQGSP